MRLPPSLMAIAFVGFILAMLVLGEVVASLIDLVIR